MNYPKIKFKISKNKEFEVFKEFLNYYKSDQERLFNWLLAPHKTFKKGFWNKGISNTQIIKLAKKYIDEYYKLHAKDLNNDNIVTGTSWGKKEKKFYNLIDEIFDHYKWPKGKYTGYLTVWGIYPRYIKEKTFCFPYKHKIKKYVLTVIAHEMLHFIFYSYLFNKYPKYKNKKYGMLIWHSSEIFNSLVQKSRPWVKLFELKPRNYPEHNEIIKKLDETWKSERKIPAFFSEAFPVIKKWVDGISVNP